MVELGSPRGMFFAKERLAVKSDQLARQIAELGERIMDEQKQLALLRSKLPPEEVQGEWVLDASGRRVELSELFGAYRDLIVVHNMGVHCSYCTLWADGFNGVLDHLLSRAAFVVASPDAPEVQRQFAESRGWRFTMVSDPDWRLSRRMGFVRQESGKDALWPGVSTFWRSEPGAVQLIQRAEFGPGDAFCAVWHLFGLLRDPSVEWEPARHYPRSEAAGSGHERRARRATSGSGSASSAVDRE
jgi:predicted dithiol-disulfide oxidoreductase (DUF899 family)